MRVKALRARLAIVRGFGAPEASPLNAAELRSLPLLTTYLSLPRDRRRAIPSRTTIKSPALSIDPAQSRTPSHATRRSHRPVTWAFWKAEAVTVGELRTARTMMACLSPHRKDEARLFAEV